MEEASLHSIPSHGHNYRGVVPLKKQKQKQNEKGIRHLAMIECPLYLRHSAGVFAVVMYGGESWAIKKAGRQRIDAFELWC